MFLATSLALVSSTAQAQVVGTILGSVFDQTGMPIKGVKVSAKSDTQIGGAKVSYTNDEGNFRFHGLQPGVFEVTATAPKLRTVIQKDIKVGLGSAAEVTLVMEVETSVEEVKVVEKAPVVSTTTAAVKQTYDEEFVDALPLENRFAVEDFVGNNAPGAIRNSLRTFSIGGGNTNQSAMLLEGFRVNANGQGGLPGQKITTASLAALEITTAGQGAEASDVPGGVVNMVTKSGSNKYEVDIAAWHEDSALTLFKDASDLDTKTRNTFINPAFSGPIIKDRLWFYVNGEWRGQVFGREKDPTGILPDPPTKSFYSVRGAGKITWQVTPRNKLQNYTHISADGDKNDHSNNNNTEPDALRMIEKREWFSGTTWEALLSDNVFFKSQIGWQRLQRGEWPERCRAEPDECEHIPQLRQTFPRNLNLQNHSLRRLQTNEHLEFINTLEWFANAKNFGDHAVKLRSRIYANRNIQADSTPGDEILEVAGETPFRRTIFYTNDPRQDDPRFGWQTVGSSGLLTNHSLSDSMRFTRHFTLSPGIAFDTARAGKLGEGTNFSKTALTPHISAAWDATHDGRTVIRGSFNQYVDLDVIRLAKFDQGGRVNLRCNYNANTGLYDAQCVYAGGTSGRTFGLPCGSTGVNVDGSPCKEELKVPRTWEYTAGAEREIVPGVGFGADLVYRLFTYNYENRETNRVWNAAGTNLDPTGSFRNGRNQAVTDLGTPADARRRYLGVTASLRKREGVFKANVSYTWSRLEGNVGGGEGGDFGTNPARDQFYLYGYLPGDARHSIRAAASLQATRWLSTGLIYRYTSGGPYNRNFRNDVLNNFSDLRATVGMDPGNNLNDPSDDRALRLPDIQEVNLQFRANMKPLFGINLETYVDVINALALRTTTGVEEQEGPAFGLQTSRKEPMRLRIGMRYRY